MNIMKITLFISLLFSISKASLIVGIGMVIKNHFNSFLKGKSNVSGEDMFFTESPGFYRLIN